LIFTQSQYKGDDDTLTIKPFGDWHKGHVNYVDKLVDKWLNELSYNVRGLLMGDLMEVATKTSIGKGLFDTDMTPQRQKEFIIEKLRSKAQFIDGAIIGNHEERIVSDTSLDLMKDVCQALNIPYLHYKGFVKYAWNHVAYVIEMWHGSGKGVTIASALQQCEAMVQKNVADVYCMGHVHKIGSSDRVVYIPDTRNNKMVRTVQRFVLTGSALDYDEGYADMKDLQERRLGYPTIELRGIKGEKGVEVRT
jgi:hypothetical protein